MTKFPITERSLENLREAMEKQDRYGLDKYGQPLNYRDNYDWDAMQDEELADFIKYRQCARERKREVIELLEMGLRSDRPREYIEVALGLLKVKGTGK